MLFRTSPPTWNLTRLPADSPVTVQQADSPVTVQQADTHLNGSPPQKICRVARAFLKFPLFSVNSGKLCGAHGQGLRVVSPEEGDFYFFHLKHPGFMQIML